MPLLRVLTQAEDREDGQNHDDQADKKISPFMRRSLFSGGRNIKLPLRKKVPARLESDAIFQTDHKIAPQTSSGSDTQAGRRRHHGQPARSQGSRCAGDDRNGGARRLSLNFAGVVHASDYKSIGPGPEAFLAV
jgi:hypothetical protein